MNKIPLDIDVLKALFEFLDKNLSNSSCQNDFSLTIKFLEREKIQNIEEILSWFNDNGGFCDCEVLANVEDKFE